MSDRSKWVPLILAVAATLWLIYYLFWVWARATHPAIYVLTSEFKDSTRLILSGFIVAIVIGVELVFFRWFLYR